jgi:integrase
MILVAPRTGMRIGELLALQWQDLDLVAGRFTVRRNVVWGHLGTPKSGKSREIPLSNDAQRHVGDREPVNRSADTTTRASGGARTICRCSVCGIVVVTMRAPRSSRSRLRTAPIRS